MIKSKKIKALLMTMSLSLLSIQSVHAASYTVQSGDSLYKIGRLFSTAANTIMQNNNLSSTLIYPGQVLKVSSQTYTVKSGDSLYLIAQNFGVSVDSLRKANNKWDNLLYLGQTLNIPSNNYTSVSPNSGQASASVISHTEAEIDLLARLIKAEAEGQPYTAKVAVGAVVVNRVQDSRFPSTVTSVVYQKDAGYYQFTPVVNGMINKPATAEDRKAALEALSGADPTKGALYYFDDSTTNKWLWSKTVALRVDRMVFSYY
ncbi:LysM peptidoglycan-binding domain-containing protein [Clostridium sp. CX1]|uniref:LysM peptidoglycan-binding domain-containing protein n=1 Tax=Clostridium sp. CX1 TaxID=2978346 RepID=UPI0021BF7490|nr:LysM peptidoglycan-binding domain-containing protein [Clostridium sp. CX1]MCT8975354.1 LysM peptidoglycan-binding domain-containing protein [Clostridium sp. CX1]